MLPVPSWPKYSVAYALIRDADDQPFRADLLGRLLADRRAHGVPTTVRDTRGSDIDGACGQLAAVDQVEGVPSVASSLAETVSAAVGEDVAPLGAAPDDD